MKLASLLMVQFYLCNDHILWESQGGLAGFAHINGQDKIEPSPNPSSIESNKTFNALQDKSSLCSPAWNHLHSWISNNKLNGGKIPLILIKFNLMNHWTTPHTLILAKKPSNYRDMDHKWKLNWSLKIRNFSIIVIALGIVSINTINMPNLERGYLLHPLVKLKTWQVIGKLWPRGIICLSIFFHIL